MGNLHRIKWIDSHIRSGLYPNCRMISEKFEISRRQASRDIEYLKDSLNAPVEYSAKYNGYYYKDRTYLLPFNIVTSQEKKTLDYLEDNYRAMGNESAMVIADLFSRISGRNDYYNLNNNTDASIENEKEYHSKYKNIELRASKHTYSKLSLIPPDIDLKIYNVLRTGVEQLVKVELEYMDARFNRTSRIISPYKIFLKHNKLYVVGFCDRRKALRVFGVKRILKAKNLSQSFNIIETFNSEDYGEQRPFLTYKPYTACINFDDQIDLSQYTIGKGIILSVEENKYEFEFTNSQQMLVFLLSSQKGFEIMSPNWLKHKLISYLKNIIEKNS